METAEPDVEHDGPRTLKGIVDEDLRVYFTGSDERPVTAENIALHWGAFAWSTLAALTGDYIALGGYDGAHLRLEMGLTALKEKVGAYGTRKNGSAEKGQKPLNEDDNGIPSSPVRSCPEAPYCGLPMNEDDNPFLKNQVDAIARARYLLAQKDPADDYTIEEIVSELARAETEAQFFCGFVGLSSSEGADQLNSLKSYLLGQGYVAADDCQHITLTAKGAERSKHPLPELIEAHL